MSCNNKIKQRCGSTVYGACVRAEVEPNNNSSLSTETCLSSDECLQDIYNQLEQIELSALGDSCLEYVEESGKIYVKNVLKKFEETICDLKTQVEALQTTALCNTIITDCNLNFGALVDECGEQPTTLSETLQLILNQLNS